MGLNIKNSETVRLIRELAELTGEGQTAAVTKAVRERITSIRKRHGHGRYERMMAIAAEMAPYLSDVPDIDELLYDPDTGLPR